MGRLRFPLRASVHTTRDALQQSRYPSPTSLGPRYHTAPAENALGLYYLLLKYAESKANTHPGYLTLQDEELMDIVRDQSEGGALQRAFWELEKRYARRFITWATGICHSRDRAEEYAQDTWLQVYRSRETWDPEEKRGGRSFRAWARTILRRIVLRGEKRERDGDLPDPALLEAGGHPPFASEVFTVDFATAAILALRMCDQKEGLIVRLRYYRPPDSSGDTRTELEECLAAVDLTPSPSFDLASAILEGHVAPNDVSSVSRDAGVSRATVMRARRKYLDNLKHFFFDV